jgi:long-subunit fatty acid transport protein
VHKTLLVLAAVAAPLTARANAFDLFGAGARAQGMAGAVGAAVDDYTAVWHNPAALTGAEKSVGVGLVAAFDRSSVLLFPRPSGYDPPGYGARAERADSDELRTTTALLVGISFPLFLEDLRVGALLLAPFGGFGHVTTHFDDEREQHFDNRIEHDLLGERLRSEVIAGALAYRIGTWLSLGVGLTLLPSNETDAYVYTPNPTDPSQIDANLKVEQTWVKALTVGVLVEPIDRVRISAGFHDEDAFDLRVRSHVTLGGTEGSDADDPYVQNIDTVVHYSPPRFRLGAALLLDSVTLTAEGTYRAWSRLRDHHGAEAGFDDTIDIAAGFEYQPTATTFLRAGGAWHPSPVPPQTGRTNYVDNDRVVVALGAGRRIGERWMVDFGVQIHALLQQDTYKRRPAGGFPVCAPDVDTICDEVPDRDVDRPGLPASATKGLQTGNPGFPGFSSGGYVVGTSLDLRYVF